MSKIITIGAIVGKMCLALSFVVFTFLTGYVYYTDRGVGELLVFSVTTMYSYCTVTEIFFGEW